MILGEYNNTDDIITNMLIDDGVISRINRKNLLNDKYHYFGVSKGFHKIYKQSTLICFASKCEEIPKPKPSYNRSR